MKTIYLIRHAKSSWEFDLEDHERPLNERGLNDAPLVAEHIKALIKNPERIVSSDAMRAKTTAALYLKVLGIPDKRLELEPKLYDFNGREVERFVKACDDKVEVLMVFGHNNAMTAMVNQWGDKKIDNVATAAFTAITFDQDKWAEIKNGTTQHHIKPKHLK